MLSNALDKDRVSTSFGTTSSGASSAWSWYESQIDLMSETNVFGTSVWSSSGYDIGIDNRQYAIFQLKPEFKNSYGNTRFTYWLKNVASSTYFSGVINNGDSDYGGVSGYAVASANRGVRPRFLIG